MPRPRSRCESPAAAAGAQHGLPPHACCRHSRAAARAGGGRLQGGHWQWQPRRCSEGWSAQSQRLLCLAPGARARHREETPRRRLHWQGSGGGVRALLRWWWVGHQCEGSRQCAPLSPRTTSLPTALHTCQHHHALDAPGRVLRTLVVVVQAQRRHVHASRRQPHHQHIVWPAGVGQGGVVDVAGVGSLGCRQHRGAELAPHRRQPPAGQWSRQGSRCSCAILHAERRFSAATAPS